MEQSHHVESWYGLSAEIAVENNLCHLVKVGNVALNHPPLVNLVLRWGLPRQERLYLSFLHEFGHLQTLPVAVFHVLWLWQYGSWRGRGFWSTITTVLAAIVAHQATWELASESYVVVKAGQEYGRIYRQYPNPLGQALFWSGTAALAVFMTGWVLPKAATARYEPFYESRNKFRYRVDELLVLRLSMS